MRFLPTDEQQSRKDKILQAVVHLYIKTGKPVGSSSIVENYRINLSPATIRNVLADLERGGYLTHPHTSAGRVPTDLGYRSYVNSIVQIQELAVEEEKRIRNEYSARIQEVEELMRSTTKVLSSLSDLTGFVMTPKVDSERLRRVELIPVNREQVLAVLVSDSGRVRNQMIRADRVPEEDGLRGISRFLNERLSGMPMTEAHDRFAAEITNYHATQAANRQFLNNIAQQLFHAPGRAEIFLEGASNLFKFPEFQDFDSMRSFAQLVDERETLCEVLSQELTERGIQVKIGHENAPGLKEFSVVSTMYKIQGRPMGVLGILGPRRMQYDRMMAIVNSVASLVNSHFEKQDDNSLKDSSDASEE